MERRGILALVFRQQRFHFRAQRVVISAGITQKDPTLGRLAIQS
jgi:hypothetical protein